MHYGAPPTGVPAAGREQWVRAARFFVAIPPQRGSPVIFGKKSSAKPEFEEEDEDFEHITFKPPLNGNTPDLGAHARLAEAGLAPAKELVSDALLRRAEMVRLDVRGNAAAVRLYIDGVAYPGGRMGKQQAAAITQVLKLLAGLEVKVRDRRQHGGMKCELDDEKYVLRVETAPGPDGPETLIVRAENPKTTPEKPEELGISDELRDRIRSLTGDVPGLVLVCGPPMSGVTAAAFGVLRCVDAYVHNIVAVGDLEGRDLHTITEKPLPKGQTLPDHLDRLLRAEAEVVFVDPIEDADTAKTLFAYGDRLAVIGEFAAKDLANGVGQLLKWTGDPAVVADRLAALVQPMLVRRLCPKCKQAFRPNPKLLDRVGLPPETDVLFRPPPPDAQADPNYEPCRRCGGVGYRDRVGLYAFLEMTDGMKAVLTGGKISAQKIRDQMKSEGMQTFEREGVRLVAEGVTSLEELQRAFSG